VANAPAARGSAAPAPSTGAGSGRPTGGPAEAPREHEGYRPLPRLRSLPAWSYLFARDAPEFGPATPGRILEDVRGLALRLSQPDAVAAAVVAPGLRLWSALAGLLLALAVALVCERRRPRRWRAAWTGARLWRRRDRGWRLATRVVERAAVPLGALVLWTLEGDLLGVSGAAFEVPQGLLAIWTAFRLADETFRRLLRGADGPAPPAAGLHGLAVFAAWWVAGWWVLRALEYRPDAEALWLSAGHLCLVVGAFRVLARREETLGLLPDYPNGAYQSFRRALHAVYGPLAWGSLAVALLWVAGWKNLAHVFLGRGWAVVGLGLGAAMAHHGLRCLLEAWVPASEERAEERRALIAAAHRLATLVLVFLTLALLLRVLELREPLLALLDRGWFAVARAEITGRMLWRSAALIVFAVFGSGLIQALLAFRVYPAMGIGAGEAYAFNRLLHYAVVAGAGLLILNTLGLSPESLAIVLGGLSVGLGFGLQNIANNLASGLILLTSRQVRRGDVITVGDQTGAVREVTLRATVLTTVDNVDVIIPNSKLLADTLINWTHSTSSVRVRVPFGVSYRSDPDAVIRLAQEVAGAHPEVLAEPAPTANLMRLGDSALEFQLLAWVDLGVSARERVISDLYRGLLAALREAGMEVPFPQRDLHIRTGAWERPVGPPEAAD